MFIYLRIATVSPDDECAQGHTTSLRNPLPSYALTKESHADKDPTKKKQNRNIKVKKQT